MDRTRPSELLCNDWNPSKKIYKTFSCQRTCWSFEGKDMVNAVVWFTRMLTQLPSNVPYSRGRKAWPESQKSHFPAFFAASFVTGIWNVATRYLHDKAWIGKWGNKGEAGFEAQGLLVWLVAGGAWFWQFCQAFLVWQAVSRRWQEWQ